MYQNLMALIDEKEFKKGSSSNYNSQQAVQDLNKSLAQMHYNSQIFIENNNVQDLSSSFISIKDTRNPSP